MSPQISPTKLRADELLVRQGLARSRSHARDLIKRGGVLNAEGLPVDKPSRMFSENEQLNRAGNSPESYVSRAGEKLHAYLHSTDLTDLTGWHVLDLGASTGGFTDCALRHGAASVTCLDVGHEQLAANLRADTRITNLEGLNARELSHITLPRTSYDLVTLDLSFISLKLVLKQAWERVDSGGYLIALIKPQFEVGRDEISNGGIVRDPSIRQQAITEIESFMRKELSQCRIHGQCASPLPGGCGNEEHLIGLHKDTPLSSCSSPKNHQQTS